MHVIICDSAGVIWAISGNPLVFYLKYY